MNAVLALLLAAHMPLPPEIRRDQVQMFCWRDPAMCEAIYRAGRDGEISDREYRRLNRRWIARLARKAARER